MGHNLVESKSITSVFESVANTEGSLGVVPLENSLEGPVNETLDNLYSTGGVYVNAVLELEISLVIASRSTLRKVRKLYSHQHALRELRKGVLESLGIDIIPVESTSQAAILASMDHTAAALCSKTASQLYGLDILMDGIQEQNNYTRFAVVSRSLGTKGDRTMVLATVPHRPGGLLRLLEQFYAEAINLTMIYSRPLRGTPWQYYFLLEFEGCLVDTNVERCMRRASTVCHSLKTCGSYYLKQLTRN